MDFVVGREVSGARFVAIVQYGGTHGNKVDVSGTVRGALPTAVAVKAPMHRPRMMSVVDR